MQNDCILNYYVFKAQFASNQGIQKLSGLSVCPSGWPSLFQLVQIVNFRITIQILIKSGMI